MCVRVRVRASTVRIFNWCNLGVVLCHPLLLPYNNNNIYYNALCRQALSLLLLLLSMLMLLSFGYSKLVEIRAAAAIIRNYKFKNKHSHA